MEYSRASNIEWLEINRGHGSFQGFPENELDFNTLSDEELKYYHSEWVLPDRQSK